MPGLTKAKKAYRSHGAVPCVTVPPVPEALRVSEMRYRRLFEAARDGIVLLNATTAKIEDANPFLTELLGYSHAELLGKKLWEVGAFNDVLENQEKFAELQTRGFVSYDDLPLRKKNGEKVPVEFVSNTYDCAGVTVIQCNIRDISARKRADEKINELAFYDPLTRVPNRTLLLDRLQQDMIVGNRNASYGAVLFLDLDHFKTLNDTLGHDMGDVLLQQVAQRLTDSVREGDTVARLGGDEFVVVLESLHTHPREASNHAKAVGEKILAALNQPYRLGDVDYRNTASIGATLFSGSKEPIEDLLKQADLAMYKCKEIGRNGLQFFDPAMQTAIIARAVLEKELRHAIAGNQLVLHYQPQVVGDRRRSAGALAAPGARTDGAGRLYSAGRRDRPDRTAGPVGSTGRLCATGALGRQTQDPAPDSGRERQCLPVPTSRLRGTGACGAGEHRRQRRAPETGVDRESAG